MSEMRTLDEIKAWAETVPGIECREEVPEVPFGATAQTMYRITASIPTMTSTNMDELFLNAANEMREWIDNIRRSSPEFSRLQAIEKLAEEVTDVTGRTPHDVGMFINGVDHDTCCFCQAHYISDTYCTSPTCPAVRLRDKLEVK